MCVCLLCRAERPRMTKEEKLSYLRGPAKDIVNRSGLGKEHIKKSLKALKQLEQMLPAS